MSTALSFPVVTLDESQEIINHRKAVKEIRERCHGFDAWLCAEALLYVIDGDSIVERFGLWIFPNANERYLISTSDDNGGVDEYYILVRLEGKSSLDKLSLGVCRTHAAGIFTLPSSTPGAPLDVDPTMGHVIRIISIEKDGDPLQSPEDASPTLSNARHIREVVRKQAGKSDTISASETPHSKFGVLRTLEYMNAMEKMGEDDCSQEEWEAGLKVLEDPEGFPWKLAKIVDEMGAADRMKEAEDRLLPCGRMHLYKNIWLVDESLPLRSNEFLSMARWGVMKSIQGTGSIPRSKMWESVVMHDDSCSHFTLVRTA
jgi:hypothetical protein